MSRMAFWHRLNQSRVQLLSLQFKRCYVQSPCAPLLYYTTKTSKSYPFVDVFKRPTCERSFLFSDNVRSFATSFQAKTKKDDKGNNGPRLNDEVTAQFVRLVTDEGHGVVRTCEALEQARKLKLDLVEVSRNVDPPVCKIMDFHKVKYKRQVMEKDRAKSKLDVTLKKGDCKEVRFYAKTEQKDLKIKADSVIRLIERGYRVKCMALGSSKRGGRASLKKGYGDEDLTEEEIAERRRQEEEEEKEELRALLSRLTAMLGDEFIIESGPRVEKKQAYVLVRHAKFGQSKKGGAKKSKDVGKVSTSQPTANSSNSIGSSLKVEKDAAESGVETEDEILSDEDENDLTDEPEDDTTAWSVQSTDDFEKVFDLGTDDKVPSTNHRERLNGPRKADSSGKNFGILNLLQPKPVKDSSPQPSPGIENRYKPRPSLGNETRYNPQPSLGNENRYKSEPRQQFRQSTSRDSRGPDKTGSFSFERQFSPQNGHPQSGINVAPSVGESKPDRADPSFRNMKLPPGMLKQKPNDPSGTSSASSFGIFSSPKVNAPDKIGVTGEIKNSTGNRYNSGRDSDGGVGAKVDRTQRPGVNGGGQARWGIFSRDGSNENPNRMSK